MTSPYTTGGGGAHLEARITAFCLSAVLSESSVRGLMGEYATKVVTQRANLGNPLDDIIIEGVREDGQRTQLDLQIKTTLSFTKNDAEWVKVLHEAWSTFSKDDFNPLLHRIGLGIGTYNAKIDQHYQAVLRWAEHSPGAQDFYERIRKKDYSSQDKRNFVDAIKDILTEHLNRPLTEHELWCFCKAFVIVHWDLQSSSGSREQEHAVDRIKSVLNTERRDDAPHIWDHLVSKAGELISTGGGATRGTLVQQLARLGFTIESAPSSHKDILALHRESLMALSDIKSHIRGLKVHRSSSHEKIRQALSTSRFVQINGEPGTGKSALLKEISEECAHYGSILVLKDSRIHPRGWSAHAHVLNVQADLETILREFACAGESILFIDGIDKITNPSIQITVNDVIRVIANSDQLSDWRILVTIREQNLKHLETWLDPEALRKLPIQTITIEPLQDNELELISDTFPQLRPLLSQPNGSDVILKRPFFLNALLSLESSSSRSLAATEVDLLNLWWSIGGSEEKGTISTQQLRNLILQAANAVVNAPNMPIPVYNMTPEALELLKSSGVFRDKEMGHSVVFAHDIYEEWSLCELLIGDPQNIPNLLARTSEPDILLRPIQLLGEYLLETQSTPETWKALFESLERSSLRTVWHRALLTSCLQSTRTTSLLDKLAPYLFENDYTRLRKLLCAVSTVEVLPNPFFLNEQLTPDVNPEDRAKYAHMMAVPKLLTWVRFLDWLMPNIETLPPSLIPELVPIFKTWQDNCSAQNIRHCREIAALSYKWLQEIESSSHPTKWSDYRRPFNGELNRDIEKPIRALFLTSAGDVPDLSKEYLLNRISDKQHVHMFRAEILQNSANLVRYIAADFVDFMLQACLEDPDDREDPFGSFSDHVFQELGISHDFYPASPLQPPFLALLRLNEPEGLRLINGFCNHSIRIWKKSKEANRRHSSCLTPIPITLEFPWGSQTFWGDGQVYLWFRGEWGSDGVRSALMALEQWALDEIQNGKNFSEIFKKVVDGNETVAALGVAVSLCIASNCASPECALPLVTCTHLHKWDLIRSVQIETPMPSNELGNWHQDRHYLQAVRLLNQRPHRKSYLQSLFPYFVFSGDESIREKYLTAVKRFSETPPISYQEENRNAAHMASLQEDMVILSERADPQYWKSEPTEDGKYIKFWCESPTLQQEKFETQRKEYTELNEYLSISLWARRSLEKKSIDEKIPLQEALLKAQSWDMPEIFDFSREEETLNEQNKALSVAGAACIASLYAPLETWTPELAQWCFDVFERAATAPETSEHISRKSILSQDPVTFAAHGLSALLVRKYNSREVRLILMSLAVDPLEEVQKTVFDSARRFAETDTHFYWTLFALLIHATILERGKIPNFHSASWEEEECKAKLELLSIGEEHLAQESMWHLPHIPVPWIKTNKTKLVKREDTSGYERNGVVFLWNEVENILPSLSFEPIFSDNEKKGQFLQLVRELLEFTFQEIVPPFASSRREARGNTPFEWVFRFSNWCGKLCAYLTRDEAIELIIKPIWSQHTDTALLMLRSAIPSFMVHALLKPEQIREDHVVLWSEIIEWLLASPEWTSNKNGEYLDREFTSCAISALFCGSQDFAPMVCGIDPSWPNLDRFLSIIERAVKEFGQNETLYFAVTTFLKAGGFDLMPAPALQWLHILITGKKNATRFWNLNGEETVSLLKKVLSEKQQLLTSEHKKLIKEIADVLIDCGVRGAGFLQQEILRA